MKNSVKKAILFALGCSVWAAYGTPHFTPALKPSTSDLAFQTLSRTWDEGIPLGNAVVGSLVWQRGAQLRFSLDRTDLWDLRPTDSLSGPNYRFSWVKEQVDNKNYLPVQQKFDHPYDQIPAPSKIPGAALEFSLDKIGLPNHVQLYLNNAVCEVKWPNGAEMYTFVHADEPLGWFCFNNLTDSLAIRLVVPPYSDGGASRDLGPVEGLDLKRLGYAQGELHQDGNKLSYRQHGWGGYHYDVAIEWVEEGSSLYGVWSVTSSLAEEDAAQAVAAALERGVKKDYNTHMAYWNTYWKQSSIAVPDSVIQRQYDNEMYKLGSASREHSYPISLQAVWTADNGRLPPWKGDYHHDLNTQLSYWPVYTGNHLNEGLGFLNTLWAQRGAYKRYTRQFFGVDGLNVPGVCTLAGEPMGGWIQYAMSPSIGAWLSHHFYLHWKYSGDRTFLKEKAYPFIKDAAVFLENFSAVDSDGVRRYPLSSSPEYFDNSIEAWFQDMTNFDLALAHFVFQAASELASELSLVGDARHWAEVKRQLPDFALDDDGALSIAKGVPYDVSHRHLSHLMAIYPLGLLDYTQSGRSRAIIDASLSKVESIGTDYWTGYSFSWFGLLKARTYDGNGALRYLRDFANHFCLANTFHANGDQTKSGKSKFTYRPFTLEGNFAFAAGVQEMVLQSHAGYIRVFPAIPDDWRNVSFEGLRAMGGFLVSAEKKNGEVTALIIESEHENELRLFSPFKTNTIIVDGEAINVGRDKVVRFSMSKGQTTKITSMEGS